MKIIDRILILAILAVVFVAHTGWADVAPGDIITKDNYEKVKGMVPDAVLNWVKKGDMELNIGKLTYNPAEYFSPEVLESFKTNKGKYDIDAKDGIIGVKTGKLPKFIEGYPFPDSDPKDPKFIQKLMYNSAYASNLHGNMLYDGPFKFIGRSGYEREIIVTFRVSALDGNAAAKKLPNPKNIESYEIVMVTKPYDMAGIATLTHRYRKPAQLDLVYNYIPDIRRTRRASPTNRSENFAGTDLAIDDGGGFRGKIPDFEWKFIEAKEALVPYLTGKPGMLKKNKYGDWETTGEFGHLIFGYQKEGWKGAPWAMTNIIWVKQKVYVAELRPKDPAYNYGVQHLWIDPDTFMIPYKLINDRDNKHWKTSVNVGVGLQSPTGEKRLMWLSSQVIVDDRSDHATLIELISDKNKFVWPAKLNMSDFSLGGFTKFCK